MDELPVRPHVPASAGAAAAVCAVSALLLQLGWEGYAAGGTAARGAGVYAAVVAAALFALGVAAAMRLVQGRWSQPAAWLAWAGAGALVATVASGAWLAAWDARCSSVVGRTASSCTFLVTGDASVSDYGVYCTADAYDGDGAYLGAVRLGTDEVYDVGTVISAVGTIEALDDSDWGRSRFMKGEVAVVDAVLVLAAEPSEGFAPIAAARLAALSAIEPEAGEARALLAGIVCGCTTWLNQTEAADDFSRCGLTHLVAVSGSHLAYISLLLEGALRRLRVRPAARMAVLGGAMGAYVVFTGCAPSAVRSVCMVVSGMVAGLGERRSHPLSGLALTVCALVLVDAGTVMDVGFQLSAMSVLFILAFGRYLTYLLGRAGLPGWLAEPLSLTLCAQWATIPITVPVFGELSLVAPLANLVAGPLMSALLMAGLVCVPVAALFPPLAPVLAVPCALANASIFVGALFAAVPYAALAMDVGAAALLPLYALALAVYLLWRDWRRWQLAGALAVCLLLAGGYVVRWTRFAPAAITVLDVGQADAILVRDGASTLLVDAGVDDEVVAALARNHVLQIDAVLITHWDSDHYGGLVDVLEAYPVGCVIVAAGASESMPSAVSEALTCEVVELACGETLQVGGFSCEMVWPVGEVAGEENEESVVLSVTYDAGGRTLSALLTGDTESDELEQYAAAVGDIDFLKVGHHGSKVSVSEAALAVLQPELAVASAGEGNSYGHPTEACIELLEEAGALFLCTIEAGDVRVCPAADGVRVVVQRDG